jgi:hypothetical protein
VKHFCPQYLRGCEGSLGSLMTSKSRTWVSCERTQCQDSHNHKTTPHAIALSDHEDAKVCDGACNNASLTQTSTDEWKLANQKLLPSSVPEGEGEICFGMVSLRMQMMTVKAPRGLTRLQTDLRRESSRVESVSA